MAHLGPLRLLREAVEQEGLAGAVDPGDGDDGHRLLDLAQDRNRLVRHVVDRLAALLADPEQARRGHRDHPARPLFWRGRYIARVSCVRSPAMITLNRPN